MKNLFLDIKTFLIKEIVKGSNESEKIIGTTTVT